MKFVLDTHTHTYASGHAYNTMNEMAKAASDMGLQLLGITDHAPQMPGSCTHMHFMNLRACPREKYGIRLLLGVELNILDYEGHVDLPTKILEEMDLVIASIHPPCFEGGSKEENTRAYLNVMDNPYIDVIGHPDDGRFPIDYEALVAKASEKHIMLELNNSSLLPGSFRPGARENYEKMLKLCKENRVPILLSSDAHVEEKIGHFEEAEKLLDELDFPEEYIANCSLRNFEKFLDERRRTC